MKEELNDEQILVRLPESMKILMETATKSFRIRTWRVK